MPSLFSRCALGAATLLAMSLVAAPAAQATDVDDARTQVQELGREVEIAAEEYNDVRVRLDTQKSRVAAAETRVSSQSQAIAEMQAELGALAVETFKRGGVDPQLAAVLGDPGDYVSSSSALTLMAERRSTSLSTLKTAQEELVDLEAAAAAELAEVEAMEDDLAARKTRIEERLAGAEDVLAEAEAEAARIEAARRAAEERATRAREAAALAAQDDSTDSGTESGSAEGDSSNNRSAGGSSDSAEAGGASASAGAEFTSAGTINCGGTSVEVPDDRVATVLGFACAQMGKPYAWGSSGPNSYDCSGLTAAAWAQVGVSLPHSSKAQAGYGTRVSRGEMRPGDLVFSFSPISHVGIYIGGGRFVAAPSAGDVVKIQSLEYLPFNTAVRL
ncbi:NlpC/P60 family protein [Jannaschia sp. R86511]|uniref:C40 family peptidase n=1 Tax=Jannaschia sp. R86511 TaxID=3093853 RepID=UPI0036D27EF1